MGVEQVRAVYKAAQQSGLKQASVTWGLPRGVRKEEVGWSQLWSYSGALYIY